MPGDFFDLHACNYCGALLTASESGIGAGACPGCREVDKRINDFVTTRAGLERTLAALYEHGVPAVDGHARSALVVAMEALRLGMRIADLEAKLEAQAELHAMELAANDRAADELRDQVSDAEERTRP